MRFCALAECGTQVLIGAKVGVCATGEQTLAHQVLDHADKSMLLMAERGFVGYPLWKRALQTEAKLWFRARDNQVLPVDQQLDDGSYFSEIFESPKARRHGRKSWLRSILMEIAAKRSEKSRGKTSPRGVTRKMSNLNLRCRGQPIHRVTPIIVQVIGC